MGWAKYYEDDLSICYGRMAMKETVPVYHKKEKPVAVKKAVIVSEETDNKKNNSCGRRGLKLSFQNAIDDKLMKKLQINGWWWSKSNACWYNMNTIGNRRYAEQYRGISGMRLVIVNG